MASLSEFSLSECEEDASDMSIPDSYDFSDNEAEICQPVLSDHESGNLFIKNLDKSFGDEDLDAMFSEFGEILSYKVSMDDLGSRGYGYVNFKYKKDADDAISEMDGKSFRGKKIQVSKFIPKAKRERLQSERKLHNFKNVYIKNFGNTLDEENLWKLCKQYGKISNVKIMRDDDGESKGFGFVCFKETDSAQKAVEGLNGKAVNGQPLYAGRAQSKLERLTELRIQMFEKDLAHLNLGRQNLYVKNLDDSIDDEKLLKEFSRYGTITSAKIMRACDGKSKGFGFVCFSTKEEAVSAISKMHGTVLGQLPLYVSVAQPKAERRALLHCQNKYRTEVLKEADLQCAQKPPSIRSQSCNRAFPVAQQFPSSGSQPLNRVLPGAQQLARNHRRKRRI